MTQIKELVPRIKGGVSRREMRKKLSAAQMQLARQIDGQTHFGILASLLGRSMDSLLPNIRLMVEQGVIEVGTQSGQWLTGEQVLALCEGKALELSPTPPSEADEHPSFSGSSASIKTRIRASRRNVDPNHFVENSLPNTSSFEFDYEKEFGPEELPNTLDFSAQEHGSQPPFVPPHQQEPLLLSEVVEEEPPAKDLWEAPSGAFSLAPEIKAMDWTDEHALVSPPYRRPTSHVAPRPSRGEGDPWQHRQPSSSSSFQEAQAPPHSTRRHPSERERQAARIHVDPGSDERLAASFTEDDESWMLRNESPTPPQPQRGAQHHQGFPQEGSRVRIKRPSQPPPGKKEQRPQDTPSQEDLHSLLSEMESLKARRRAPASGTYHYRNEKLTPAPDGKKQ